MQNASFQQLKVRPPVHLTLDELQTIDLPFCLPAAPLVCSGLRQRELPGGPDPVLYLHLRFRSELPESLMSIERRSYDANAETVVVRPSRKTGFLKQLGFVSV